MTSGVQLRRFAGLAAAVALCLPAHVALAQGDAFVAGEPLGVTIDGVTTPLSAKVKVYGGIVNAESCIYNPVKRKIMAINRGVAQSVRADDGFVSLINGDGTVHVTRWIGATRAGLVLNDPFGSDAANGMLYLADSDGATADGAPRTAVIRMFDLETGVPRGSIAVPSVEWFNDIAVASDGSVYATQSGNTDRTAPERLVRVAPDGTVTVIADGAPLARPNGVALDPQGNVVVVNMVDTAVLTFSPDGRLLKTEQAVQNGSDGLVILSDGTKYVSSVINGGVSQIRPGRQARLIASGIPVAASMCYDPARRQLVVPMSPNNAMAFIPLR